MDFDLSEQQKILKKSVRDFLTANCPKSLVKQMETDTLGYKPELWKAIADMGCLGLALSEEFGGSSGDFLDLSVLHEELGRALFPGPFLATIISRFIIMEAGNEAQKQRLLPQIAEGKLIIVPAWNQEGTIYDVTPQLKAVRQGSSYVLNGSRLSVPYANAADYLICQAYTRGHASTLFLVNAKAKGLKLNHLPTIAGDKQFEVEFNNVTVSPDDMLGKVNKGEEYLDKILPIALVAKSMEMLGGAQQVVEMSIEYAKQRVQFGQPIGAFQAIQHHCANMVIDLEAARYLAYDTAWMIAQGLPCNKEAYMTKSWLSDAYRRIAVLGKQVHGGTGVITEYDMQLYLRRQKTDELFLGDADLYRERIAELELK